MNETPKHYVTLIEINNLLNQLKLETGHQEDILRKYVNSKIEENSLFIQSKITAEISDNLKKISEEIKIASQLVAQQTSKELHTTFSTLVKNLKESLHSELISEVNKLGSQILADAKKVINIEALKYDKILFDEHHKSWTEIRKYQESSMIQFIDQMSEAIKSSNAVTRKNIGLDTIKFIKENTSEIYESFKNFKTHLTEQFNNKLVDKKSIDQKMTDIEKMITEKTTQVITFNIEQARSQMEAAAKAEVKEGMREAAAKILSLN